MDPEELTTKPELDISVFEIPPAAAYFETIQQLQKVNAKLDVLIRNQSEIVAKLNGTDAAIELEASRKEVASQYEQNLLHYFEGADLDPEALRGTIDPADRTEDEEGKSIRHKSIVS